MSTKKEGKVADLKGKEVNNEPVAPVAPELLKLNVEDANNFLNIIGIILTGDDRVKPLQSHFIEMIKRNNEENIKQ